MKDLQEMGKDCYRGDLLLHICKCVVCSVYFCIILTSCFIAQIQNQFDNRLLGQHCFISLDGTNFCIQEPRPFGPMWFSQKSEGPGVHYEVEICL